MAQRDRNPAPDASSRRGEGSAGLTGPVLRALRDQEPEALDLFYSAYFQRVYGYVRRLVRDEHTAEDLTQDIFMHIHKSLPGYDPERELRPWVFTIATNKLRDFWQSRRFQEGRRQASLDDEDAAPLEPVADDGAPAARMEAAELSEVVQGAVDRLPEGLRTPLVLRYYEGLSFEEIGRILDRTEVAARKRYSRALGELRRLLGEHRSIEPGGIA